MKRDENGSVEVLTLILPSTGGSSQPKSGHFTEILEEFKWYVSIILSLARVVVVAWHQHPPVRPIWARLKPQLPFSSPQNN
jgi:hypothetical protein